MPSKVTAVTGNSSGLMKKTGRPVYGWCQAKTKPQSMMPQIKMVASRYQMGAGRCGQSIRRG